MNIRKWGHGTDEVLCMNVGLSGGIKSGRGSIYEGVNVLGGNLCYGFDVDPKLFRIVVFE